MRITEIYKLYIARATYSAIFTGTAFPMVTCLVSLKVVDVLHHSLLLFLQDFPFSTEITANAFYHEILFQFIYIT